MSDQTQTDVLHVFHGCTPTRHREECKPAGEFEVTLERPSTGGDEAWTVLYEFHPFAAQVEERDGAMWLGVEAAESRPQQVTAL